MKAFSFLWGSHSCIILAKAIYLQCPYVHRAMLSTIKRKENPRLLYSMAQTCRPSPLIRAAAPALLATNSRNRFPINNTKQRWYDGRNPSSERPHAIDGRRCMRNVVIKYSTHGPDILQKTHVNTKYYFYILYYHIAVLGVIGRLFHIVDLVKQQRARRIEGTLALYVCT